MERKKFYLKVIQKDLIFCVLFRALNGNYDVWANLQNNRTDSFWLTGETPDTLNVLVRKLENIYRNIFRIRKGVLDFRKKVSSSLCFKVKFQCSLIIYFNTRHPQQTERFEIWAMLWICELFTESFFLCKIGGSCKL